MRYKIKMTERMHHWNALKATFRFRSKSLEREKIPVTAHIGLKARVDKEHVAIYIIEIGQELKKL